MGLFSRKDALPAEIRRALHLSPGDKPLGSALLTDGTWAVATQQALVVIPAQHSSRATATSWPWCDVDRASWDPQTAALTVSWVDASEPLPLHFSHPEQIGRASCRERVF